MPKKPSVSHEAAYLDYLGMGMDRSLAKLRKKYTPTTPDSPSLDSLKQWSRRYRWQDRIAQDDLEVGEKARAAATQQKGEQMATLRGKLWSAADKIIYDILLRLVATHTRTREESRITYCEMRTAIKMITLAEALPGGAFYEKIPPEWPERKKFLAAMKLPKHLSGDLKQHLE